MPSTGRIQYRRRDTLTTARRKGALSRQNGIPVTFPPRAYDDRQKAAWVEGWKAEDVAPAAGGSA